MGLEGILDGREEIRDVAATWGELESTAEEVRSTGTAPYSDVVAGFPMTTHDAFVDLVTTALRTGAVDVVATIEAGSDAGASSRDSQLRSGIRHRL